MSKKPDAPAGYRWATPEEIDMAMARGDMDAFVDVRVGGTDESPHTDLAVPENYVLNDLPTGPSGERLPLMSPMMRRAQIGPDGTSFPWGPIDKVHVIGSYQIVQYRVDASNMTGLRAGQDHGLTRYHVIVDGHSTSTSYETLDAALAGAIAYRHEGPNGRAATYFIRMIGADK